MTASVVDAEGHVDQVTVAQSFARKGIGAALIETVCAWAGERGFDSVTLTTFLDVAWNGPYYERLGFSVLAPSDCGPELTKIRRDEADAGIDVMPRGAMRKRLA